MNTSIYKIIKDKFNNCSDFKSEQIQLKSTILHLFFIDNMIDKMLLATGIKEKILKLNATNNIDDIMQAITIVGAVKRQKIDEAINDILCGFAVIIVAEQILSIPCQGYEKRAIAEPPTSAVLKGPREGFVEDITTNISMIRRKVKSADLKIVDISVGKYSNSQIKVVYISTITDLTIVNKILDRLNHIAIDAVIDSFYIQAMLEEKHSSLFKQIGNTEKPEVATSKLLEGRVLIFVDGSPMCLTLPYLLMEDFQSADDYFNHSIKTVLVRLLRVFGYILAITLPGLYVALQSYHYALLPIEFLITLQGSTGGLSFPPLIEILFVLFLFEILNEASVRMPKYYGMALSIIGALVLGDTAVQAGFISSPSVIIVAISGITLYTVPDQVPVGTVLRLLFTIVGGLAGFYGLLIGFMLLTAYLLTFDSYGAPYFAPYAPIVSSDKKDGIFKKRLHYMKTRPQSIPNKNRIRMQDITVHNKKNNKGKSNNGKTTVKSNANK